MKALLVFIFLFSTPSFSQIKSKNDRLQKLNSRVKNKLGHTTRQMDLFQSNVKRRWREMNEDVDKFFASENYEEEINESYIRVKIGMESEEGEKLGSHLDLRLQTDFPNASKNVKFIIQKESDEFSDDNRAAEPDSIDGNEIEESRYSAAGRVYWVKNDTWQMVSDLGLSFDVPLDPFVKLRLRRRFQFERARYDLIQKIEYFRIAELSHETISELIQDINKVFKFKHILSVSYERADGFYEFYNSFSILQKFKRTTSFAYAITIDGSSKPAVAVQTYIYSILMRRLIHGDWLYFQTSAGVSFPREDDFDSKAFALVSVEAFF